MLKTTPEGRLALAAILNNQHSEYTNWTVRLFKSGLTPGDGTLSSAYLAAECNFSGYAAVAFTSWNTPTDDGTITTTTDGSVLFQTAPVVTTPNNVGGYFISPTSDLSIVLWGELAASGPIPMDVAGLGIVVFPRYTIKNQP